MKKMTILDSSMPKVGEPTRNLRMKSLRNKVAIPNHCCPASVLNLTSELSKELQNHKFESKVAMMSKFELHQMEVLGNELSLCHFKMSNLPCRKSILTDFRHVRIPLNM